MAREEIELLRQKYFVEDEYGYTDKELVDKVNELIEQVNKLSAKKDSEVLDKIRAEIVDTLYVDSLIFGELFDFKNGKISADDVIEEFNRVTRLEVLKILDEYKTENEEEE